MLRTYRFILGFFGILLLSFGIACSSGGKNTPPPAPPTITGFSASPIAIDPSGNSQLSWSVTGATSMSIDHGVGTVTGNSKTVSPSETTTYTLTASNAGGSDTATTKVTVNIHVVVAPTAITLVTGHTQQFTATVTGTTNTGKTWSVVETNGGSITADGMYTAPATAGTYHVRATSQADPSVSDEATVTVDLIGVSITPSSATIITSATQDLTATITGASIDSGVTWSVVEANGGTILDKGNNASTYTAPATAGTYHVKATSIEDPTKSAVIPITVNQVTISVTPATVTLVTGHTQQFTATVTGTTNTGKTWSVVETNGGSITADGMYTAPATAGTYHVRATSQADPSVSDDATVTVELVGISISPTAVTLNQSATQLFTATVTGTTINTGVTWQVQETSGGTIVDHADNTATYTAPSTAGTFHVNAYSVEDASRVATATITVNPAPTFNLLAQQSITIQEGTSSPLVVLVNPLYGFTGTVHFTTVSPTGTTIRTAINPSDSTQSTTILVTVPVCQTTGTFDMTVTGTSGTIVVSKTVQVIVTPIPTYTLTINMGAGTTGTPNVTTSYVEGSVVNYNYSLQAGYQNLVVLLDGVSISASGSISSLVANHTISVSATPITYTVNFVAGSGGTLSGTTTQTVAYGGSSTAVTANASSGYSFTNWTGSGFTTTTSNPLTVTNVTSNLTVTANFASTNQAPTITNLTATPNPVSGFSVCTITFTLNDIDGDLLSWTASVSNGNGGSLDITSGSGVSSGTTVTIHFNSGDTTNATITINCSDGKGGTDQKQVGIGVQGSGAIRNTVKIFLLRKVTLHLDEIRASAKAGALYRFYLD